MVTCWDDQQRNPIHMNFSLHKLRSDRPVYFVSTVQVIDINLSSIVPHVSGPKRPQDRVAVSDMKEDFQSCLDGKVT